MAASRLMVSLLLRSLALASCLGTAAAQDEAAWQLGVFFWHESPNDQAALDGIRSAFKVRGRSHEFLVVQANSDRETARRLLAGLRKRRVDLVFAMGTEAALLAKEHITDLPVVFTAVTNPIETGVVPSWKGSGSNLAGNSNWIDPETTVRVFRLAVPRLQRLGVLRSRMSGVVSAAELKGLRRYLREEKANAESKEGTLEVIERELTDVNQIAKAVGELADGGVQAIWIPIDFQIYQNADKVLAAARERGLPIVSTSMKAVRTAAVAAILPDYDLLGQRAAVIALRILERRSRPQDIPIGTLRAHRVVVNLDVARRCDYELRLSALVLADQIIEGDTKTESRRTSDGRRK
ncbi:MAG: ABC transporter substrate-binding protein [Planctomycetota bacterium]